MMTEIMVSTPHYYPGYSSADPSDTSAELRILANPATSLEEVMNVLTTSSQLDCASFRVEIIA